MQMEQDSLESRLTDAYRRLVVGEKAVSVSVTQIEEAAKALDDIAREVEAEIGRLEDMARNLITDSANAMNEAAEIRKKLNRNQ